MKLDLKTVITLGGILFAIAGFYYTTVSDLNSLTLRLESAETENRAQQKRLDMLDKRVNKINKQIRSVK